MNQRWLEVKFYFLCRSILEKTSDIQTVLSFIEGMSFLKNYKIESMQKLAYRALTDPRFQPNKNEFIILASQNNVPVRTIIKKAKIHPTTYYQLLKKNKLDPMVFYSRLSPEEHGIIKMLFDTIDFIKELK